MYVTNLNNVGIYCLHVGLPFSRYFILYDKDKPSKKKMAQMLSVLSGPITLEFASCYSMGRLSRLLVCHGFEHAKRLRVLYKQLIDAKMKRADDHIASAYVDDSEINDLFSRLPHILLFVPCCLFLVCMVTFRKHRNEL